MKAIMGLWAYITRRTLTLIPTFFLITFVIFLLMHLAPGDPIEVMFAEAGRPVPREIIEQIREELGLNKPLYVQYIMWISRLFLGDLGISYSVNFGTPILSLIGQRIWLTLGLMLSAHILSLLIAVILGVIAATKQYSLIDNIFSFFSLLGYSLPQFWTSLLFIFIFGIHLKIFPTSGAYTLGVNLPPLERVMDILWHLTLPLVCISVTYIAYYFRLARAAMLEVLHQDYIVAARAKGLREKIVVYKHALRNALIPLITYAGSWVGFVFSGAVIVETIFNLPGLGSLLVEFALKRDYAGLMGLSTIICISVLIANLCTDIIYAFIDPRIKYDGGEIARSNVQLSWMRFKRNKAAISGLVIVGLIVSLAAIAPIIAPFDSSKLYLHKPLSPPSLQNPFGTDSLGRDCFRYVIWGARTSLIVGIGAVLIEILIGIIIGGIAGYFGGLIDEILMRITDTIMCMPTIVLMTVAVSMFKVRNMYVMIIAMAMISWPWIARVVRGTFLSLKHLPFVEVAKSLGAGHLRVIFKHILPNALAPIIVLATLDIAWFVLYESTLTFLGLGDPTLVSWGALVNLGKNYIRSYWWISTFPSLALSITVIGLNLLGDGIRDALDVKLTR